MTTDNGKKKDEKTGYKNHMPGSRKGTIHQLYDEEGVEVAWTRGLKMKLKESSLRSWFARWGGGKKPAPKVMTKPMATKPEVKPKAKKAAKVVKPKPEAPATAKPDGAAAAA
jgi:hypothetical protein